MMRIPPQTGRTARHPHLPPGGAEMLRVLRGYCQETARRFCAATRILSIVTRLIQTPPACPSMAQRVAVKGGAQRLAACARSAQSLPAQSRSGAAILRLAQECRYRPPAMATRLPACLGAWLSWYWRDVVRALRQESLQALATWSSWPSHPDPFHTPRAPALPAQTHPGSTTLRAGERPCLPRLRRHTSRRAR
jgi:hypothetical protein